MKSADLSAILSAIDRRQPVVRVVDMASGNMRLVGRDEISGDPLADVLAEAFRTGLSRVVGAPGQETFLDVYLPPLRLVLLGAVHIAQALIPMAISTGYAVIVIDPRTAFATKERFPDVMLDTRWPDTALAEIGLDSRTAFCALTHDPKIDEPGLAAALSSNAFYIGALGSRRTHENRCARLRELGVSEGSLDRIHAPIGLDIGAVGAAEIAVSVMAEITQTLRRNGAGI